MRKTINFIIVAIMIFCIANIIYLKLHKPKEKSIIFKYDAMKELIKVNSDSTVIIFKNRTYILKQN